MGPLREHRERSVKDYEKKGGNSVGDKQKGGNIIKTDKIFKYIYFIKSYNRKNKESKS